MTPPVRWHHPRRWGCTLVVWALMAQMVVPAHAYVSQLPGAFTAPPDANVMFTLDSSGSMQSDVIPDLLDTAGVPNNQERPEMWGRGSPFLDAQYYTNSTATDANVAGRYLRSADGNPIYYNPKVRYRPWPDPADDRKTYLPNAKVTAVNVDATDPTNATRTIDLTQQLGGQNPFWPATYFVKTSSSSLPLAKPASTESRSATFEKVEIYPGLDNYPKRLVAGEPDLRTDCSNATYCTYAEELQNFANWLQYYRSRSLMAKGGVSAAFARQGTNMRVGFGTIRQPVQLGVRGFDGASRVDFFRQLYAADASGFTPLRTASVTVGEYFKGTGPGNPWVENPADSKVGTEYSCRRSFHILSTDGFWNSTSPGIGNVDNFAGESTPPNTKGKRFPYTDTVTTNPPLPWSVSPYADGASDTLSDVAALYWKTDLRTDLVNNVIPTSRDPAFWQHLTMYTVGFGIGGTGTVTRRADGSVADLNSQDARDKLVAGRTALNWPTNVDINSPETGDDLIHASMTGHGRYMSATNPTDLANNLASALAEAVDNPGDLATLAVSSSKVVDGGTLYQATFSPARWYGRLYAFKQGADGIVNNRVSDNFSTNADQLWEASNKMPAPELRNIFTSSGGVGTGVSFEWNYLTATQKADLNNDPTLLTYLRGDASREIASGGNFRDRSRYTLGNVKGGVLGDVVGGSPLKGPEAGGGYDRLPATTSSSEQSAYANFRSANGPLGDMINTMFLGANDGMLHAFNLSNGEERFAYVPSTVYNVPNSTAGGLAEQKLKLLASPDYTHRFTVDGPPNVADAYFGGEWHSVLVGSTGAGARGIFAMDVTQTAVATGGFDAGKIMWEFSEANSADMGFVLAYPHVVRMRNGQWAVIFGNGVDSKNGSAMLFILDAQTGQPIAEFDVGTAGGNGLSQPNFVLNASREVEAIYAGDLKGNLWKFDVSATNKSSWGPAFGKTTPLFTAVGPGGQAQPITVMPEISAHPNGGAMVIFGTGKLFEPSDTAPSNAPAAETNVNLYTQSLYGIWDKPAATTGVTITSATRTTLLKPQSLQAIVSTDDPDFRRSSVGAPDWGTQRGWVFDLLGSGERSNLPPQQFRNVVFLATNTPAIGEPCANSGTSKIFALDPVTGAAPSFPVFDVNNNKLFDPDERGLNVLLNNSALLTQPVFQVSSSRTVVTPGPTVQPLAALDRGQATSARSGGVELSRATGSRTPPTSGGSPAEPDCKALMSAAQSNTALLQQLVNGCPSKTRISWRQLK